MAVRYRKQSSVETNVFTPEQQTERKSAEAVQSFPGKGQVLRGTQESLGSLIYKSLTVRNVARAFNPFYVLSNISRLCDRAGSALFTTITKGAPLIVTENAPTYTKDGLSVEPCSRKRALLAGLAVLPFAAIIKINSLIVEEVDGWADFTNFADHLQLMGCNPIPDYYYTMGHCFRFSSAIQGDHGLKPSATYEDIRGIFGRFSILTAAYKTAGLAA
ncbi:hypothetical protein [Parendozoicomonas haliclonae]|uniref:Uncharacterized protein n=1 Tax=Parendozoicomonas haliclonae TaxID=1960125 RepID=A0A1X7ALI4_9GAMM|nr:hypothetical protein [Parendozoicomonas haliclonae]SMA48220.1 hypothetical protein EHSB41UT_02652 [Parendozoicomonas haliclonae]